MIDIFCLSKKLIRRMHDKENFCREKLIVLNQSKVFCRYFLFIKKLTRKLHNKENSCRQEIELIHCRMMRARAPLPKDAHGEGLKRVTILFLSGRVSTSVINIYVNV